MNHPKPSEKRKGLGAGIIAFGVVFALFSLLFRPHTIGAFALATALSLFAGAVIRVMAQGLDVSPTVKTPESLQKVQGNTGDPDVDALLEKGRGMIAEIRAENDRIPDSSLSDKLEKLENLCAEVFRAVYDKPAKAPQIRKFMDYYLPTTLKMVRGFRTLDERGITGAQAQDARPAHRGRAGRGHHGCQRLLENLYRDDVLDLTTDIDVLEQMLKRDSLTESDLERAAAQAARPPASTPRQTASPASVPRAAMSPRREVRPPPRPPPERPHLSPLPDRRLRIMTENQNQAPALTLEPAMTRDKVMMEEAARQLEAAPAAAAEAAAEMDTSMLSEADRRAIEEFAQKIDLNNTDHVLLYGSDAQKKIADFSDSALGHRAHQRHRRSGRNAGQAGQRNQGLRR